MSCNSKTTMHDGTSVRLLRAERGSVYVEYLVITLFAGILVAKIVAPAVGGAIVTEYSQRRAILYSTTP